MTQQYLGGSTGTRLADAGTPQDYGRVAWMLDIRSMLSPRLRPTVFVVLLALVIALAVSFATTVLNHRIDEWFVSKWMRAWAIGAAVAVPTALLFASPLRAITDKICK